MGVIDHEQQWIGARQFRVEAIRVKRGGRIDEAHPARVDPGRRGERQAALANATNADQLDAVRLTEHVHQVLEILISTDELLGSPQRGEPFAEGRSILS